MDTKEEFISTGDTFGIQETTHPQASYGTSTTLSSGSSSSSTSITTSISSSSSGSSSSITTSTTSTAGTTTTTTTTYKTTPFIPPQTETTNHYRPRETLPPEPSTPEEDNEIYHRGHPEESDYDTNNHDHVPQIPETEPPPPIIFRTPPPPYRERDQTNYRDSTRSPPKNKHGRINSEAEERTAMIIGIVAGALIAVILVILLVLWIKSNGDRSYKMEHDLKYGHGANAALLGHNSGHNSNQHHGNGGGSHNHHNQHHDQSQYQHGNNYNNVSGGYDSRDRPNMGLNGSLRQQNSHYDRNGMSAGLVQPKAKRNSKDIKEWYV